MEDFSALLVRVCVCACVRVCVRVFLLHVSLLLVSLVAFGYCLFDLAWVCLCSCLVRSHSCLVYGVDFMCVLALVHGDCVGSLRNHFAVVHMACTWRVSVRCTPKPLLASAQRRKGLNKLNSYWQKEINDMKGIYLSHLDEQVGGPKAVALRYCTAGVRMRRTASNDSRAAIVTVAVPEDQAATASAAAVAATVQRPITPRARNTSSKE